MDQTWIRAARRLPHAPVRLVCFPHAGGSASFYLPLARHFGDRVEVRAVQYPGRLDRYREPAITDLGLLADRVADALTDTVEGPFAFFGHSMGAILAFEVTRRLERRGALLPEVLFASGRRAPSVVREGNVHRCDDAGVIAEIRRLGGTDAGLLTDPEMIDMIMPALRADYTAIESYRCDPPQATVGAPIEVLIGDADPRVAVEDAKSWALHTSATCAIRVFSGGHFYLAEQASEVAAHIAARLGLLSPLGQL